MIRTITLTLLAATAVVASAAAHADPVVVQVAGHSRSEVRRAVVAAADKVCAAELRQNAFSDYVSADDCVTQTVDATMQRIAANDGDRSYTTAAR